MRVLPVRRLRGEMKLGAALDALAIDVDGAIAVDVGAAAGGFTSALLARGAAVVYAVDVASANSPVASALTRGSSTSSAPTLPTSIAH